MLLARLAAEVDPHIRLVTQILIAPLYHPVMLAEEIRDARRRHRGRLVFGAGLGYRPEEFDYLRVPYKERAGRFDESLEPDDPALDRGHRHLPREVLVARGRAPPPVPRAEAAPADLDRRPRHPRVCRAAKYGDAYACPPETPKDEVARRYAIVRDGFEARGKAFGRSRCAATASSPTAARRRWSSMRGSLRAGTHLRGQGPRRHEGHRPRARVRQGAGTPSSARPTRSSQLTDYVTALPVDPLLLRPQWPTMTADETIATLDRLGRDVVPAITAITPRHDIDQALLDPSAAGANT